MVQGSGFDDKKDSQQNEETMVDRSNLWSSQNVPGRDVKCSSEGKQQVVDKRTQDSEPNTSTRPVKEIWRNFSIFTKKNYTW